MHNIKSPRRLAELAVEVDVLDHQQDLQIINIHCNGLDDAEGFRDGAGGFRLDVVGGDGDGDGWGQAQTLFIPSSIRNPGIAQHVMAYFCSMQRIQKIFSQL